MVFNCILDKNLNTILRIDLSFFRNIILMLLVLKYVRVAELLDYFYYYVY